MYNVHFRLCHRTGVTFLQTWPALTSGLISSLPWTTSGDHLHRLHAGNFILILWASAWWHRQEHIIAGYFDLHLKAAKIAFSNPPRGRLPKLHKAEVVWSDNLLTVPDSLTDWHSSKTYCTQQCAVKIPYNCFTENNLEKLFERVRLHKAHKNNGIYKTNPAQCRAVGASVLALYSQEFVEFAK